MEVTRKEIELYLDDVKKAIRMNRYIIDRNSNRQANVNLFVDYLLNEMDAKEILLSLTPEDFSAILNNEHKGFEHERLYVFGKDVDLYERFGSKKSRYLYILNLISWKTVL